jgi:FkbM family methyltransferase
VTFAPMFTGDGGCAERGGAVKSMILKALQLLELHPPPTSDTGALAGPSRREMLTFYSRFVGKGDLCFDVGANLGNRTDIFVELGATVVAIEPQDTCVKQLRAKYYDDDRVVILQTALADREGEAELMISTAHTISSLSKEWIDSVKRSGRFSAYRWDRTALVPVTTLDRLIEQHGEPSFCKIDVEGFEFQVLKGLSQPIRTISFEFIPEFLDAAIKSIRHLTSLGGVQFNYSVGESMRLTLPKWTAPDEMCQVLIDLPDKAVFGDVYAAFAV